MAPQIWWNVVLLLVEKGLWLYNPTPLSYLRWNRLPASKASLPLTESIPAPYLNWWGFTVLISYSGSELLCLKTAKWLIWETPKLEETLRDGKKIKASMHLSGSKVINTWVEHFCASQYYLVSNARKGSSSLAGLERVSFRGAAMPLPLTMCPARAGNEFSHWTNGWQRHNPWFAGGRGGM